MELDLVGRVLAQVEQARAHLPPPARVRVDDELVQALALGRHVRHLPPLRCGTRTRYGYRDEEDQVLSVCAPGVFGLVAAVVRVKWALTGTLAGANPAHRGRSDSRNPEEQAHGQLGVLDRALRWLPPSLRRILRVLKAERT